MFQHVSIEVLANWVLMLRTDVSGAILLSDDDDEARFYETCAHKDARVVPAPRVALPLLDMMEKYGVQGVIATFRGQQAGRENPNAFRHSLGDVASLFLLSDSCDKVVRDVCGSAWFNAGEKEIGSIRGRVVWLGRILEQLRQACKQHHFDLNVFESAKVIDWKTFGIAWDWLIPVLVDNGISEETLQQTRATPQGNDLRSDLLQADGMDVIGLFAVTSRMYRPMGIAASKEIEPATFIGMLRMAFDLSEFEHDKVFWQMRRWERVNVRYPILRRWRTLDPLGIVLDQRYWEADLSAILNILEPGDPLAVFKIDLDNFKQVNDELGHATGDEAIRMYCKIVLKVLGSAGEVYRRGGDEVVVLAPGLSESSARDLAELTRLEVEEKFREWALERRLHAAPTASIGLAIGKAGESRTRIIELADEAERRAKQNGKNRVVVLQ